MKSNSVSKKAFTLIELLVVISIISTLSSIIFAGLNHAKLSAQDAVSIMETRQLMIALESYYLSNGKFPSMYGYWNNITLRTELTEQNADGSWTNNKQANAWECDAPDDVRPERFSLEAWNKTMQELVDGKYLDRIPHSHPGTSPYCYFNYHQFSGEDFVLITTTLKATPDSIKGLPPSFRWPSTNLQHRNDDKCAENLNNKEYCMKISAN